MRFKRAKPKRGLVNLTPLIDVVFQLLVFFMLTANIKPPSPFPVDVPTSSSRNMGEEREGVVLIGPDGSVAFNNEMVNRPELIRGVRQLLQDDPGALVQIKADGEADANTIIGIMEDLRDAGVAYLILLARGGDVAEQEK